ncbi:hypothetical protein C8R46DRAFT_1364604 [Mycena filopes]|nr:hypothetical protein C8R46DRAFT_1364604 [Mycena filopes]
MLSSTLGRFASLLFLSHCLAQIDVHQSFFTPGYDSQLPDGTYIATGLSGIKLFAEHLDENPSANISRLLISDSTLHDRETRYGALTFSKHLQGINDWWDDRPPPTLTDEEEDEQELVRHSNMKVELKLKRAVRDMEAPLRRILDRVAPSLETLVFLTYITNPVQLDADEAMDPRIAPLVGRNYSSLRHLTFLNDDDIESPGRLLRPPTQFPALTHLHTAYYSDSAAPLSVIPERFPSLTHLLLVGATRIYSTWVDRKLGRVVGIPDNLTVIVQPGFDPMLGGGSFCGTPGVEYDDMLDLLLAEPRVHVKYPREKDYTQRRGLFPLDRSISEFLGRERGEEGQWAVEDMPHRDDWWWNRRPQSSKRDETEL